MTASPPQPVDPDGTVALPVRLAALAAFLVEHAAQEITARGGSRTAIRDLPELQEILRASATSARGRPSTTIGPRAQTTELTTTQASAVMGISARRVREHARTGRIIARKVAGRDWLIDADSACCYRREDRH